MIQNNIRALRLKKGLTQRQLAELAGTSQQQVQRIESGFQAAKVDLARQLAHALQASIRDLFPATGNIVLPKEVAPLDKEAIELAEAGIDIDPSLYRFSVRLRGGIEREFEISSRDRMRLRSILKKRHNHHFIVFNTGTERVALNLRELSFCQFLYDVGVPPAELVDCEDDEEPLKFWLTDSTDPLSFDVEPDTVDDDDEDQVGERPPCSPVRWLAYLLGSQSPRLAVARPGATCRSAAVVVFADKPRPTRKSKVRSTCA